MVASLVRGIVIGFAIAAPVGPIGVLCIRRTLSDGRVIGLATGLGAATADMTYGAIAAFGLTAISGLLISQTLWLRLVGGLFLLYLGIRTLLTRPATRAATAQGRGIVSAYLSTFGLTLTNPTTILSFVAIFAGIGVGATRGDVPGAALTVLGVFSGSALWWLLLSGTVSLFRSRFNPRALLWVNRLSGAVILLFGVAALASVVPH